MARDAFKPGGKPVGGDSGQATADLKPGPPMQLPGATPAQPVGTVNRVVGTGAWPTIPLDQSSSTPPVNPFRGQMATARSPLPYQAGSGAQTAQTPPWWPPLPPPRPADLGGPPSALGGQNVPGIYSPNVGGATGGAPIYTAANLGWLSKLFGGGRG
jgi:hypothetical protein